MVDGEIWLSASTVSDNGSHGARATLVSAITTPYAYIGNCTFTNNGGWAAFIEGGVFGPAGGSNLQLNSGSGNTLSGIALDGATVTSSSTWSSSSGPDLAFVLLDDLVVSDGANLVVNAGSAFKIDDGVEIVVEGNLYCYGASGNEVYFTSLDDDTVGGDTNGNGSATAPAAGDWGGIFLDGAGDLDGIGAMNYTVVRYGGGVSGSAGANVFWSTSNSGYFNNGTSEHSAGDGLAAWAATGVSFSNSSLVDNLGFALRMEEMNLPSPTGLTISGNGVDGIAVSGTVAANQTWPPAVTDTHLYVLLGPVDVLDNTTLTIRDGQIVKCAAASQLLVNGTLDVQGYPGRSVVFTSIADDSVGGDTNGDGGLTTPAPGDWDGIHIDGGGVNDGVAKLDFLFVKFGGNPAGDPQANLTFEDTGLSWLSWGRSSGSATDGVRVEYCSPSFYRSMIYDNAGIGLYIFGDSEPDLGQAGVAFSGWNYFAGNDSGGMEIYSDTVNTIHAAQSIWEYSSSSEIDTHIWDDDEDPSLGPVLFEPWFPNLICADGFQTGDFSNWSSSRP